MSSLTGTWALVRLFLRLDRLRLPVWILVLGAVPVGTASALQGLYATEASRLELAATVTSNPAFTALLGPLYDPSIGGLTAWRIGALGSFIVGLMAVLTMIRHTRDDEETGRRELLGSTLVGRHAPLAAAIVVTAGAGLLIGTIIAGGLAGIGLALRGSIAFGAGFAAVAIAFTAVGALTAQFTQAGSTGRGLGVAIVGLFVILRMAGDVWEASGLGWLSWLSPIGWFSRMRAFAGEAGGSLPSGWALPSSSPRSQRLSNPDGTWERERSLLDRGRCVHRDLSAARPASPGDCNAGHSSVGRWAWPCSAPPTGALPTASLTFSRAIHNSRRSSSNSEAPRRSPTLSSPPWWGSSR